MGRKPTGKKAMTDAERQRKRRKKLRKEKLALGAKAEKEKARLKEAEGYMPMPPGVTWWRKVRVGGAEILQPLTQPLPGVYWHELRDEDLNFLITAAQSELDRRVVVSRLAAAGEAG
jgi:hypothetical protein